MIIDDDLALEIDDFEKQILAGTIISGKNLKKSDPVFSSKSFDEEKK